MNALVLVDESPIKINGEQFYLLIFLMANIPFNILRNIEVRKT